MDERQTQIREGAGLEESKLNVEFIEWLRRWSTPLLLVAAVSALGWVLYQKYDQAQSAKVDRAFGELETALVGGSPETLKAVADEYGSTRAVPVLARLAAADAYLQSARAGLKPGATPKPDGTYAPEDLVDDKARADTLDQADQLYTRVLSATESDNAQAIHAMGAAFGLGAVAETRGQPDKAKDAYERVATIAQRAGFPAQGEIAKKRIADLPSRADAPRLFAKADLPAAPTPPPPPAPPGPSGPTAVTGSVFTPPPAETPAPHPAPTGAPASTGEPAPTGAPAPTAPPAANPPAPDPKPAAPPAAPK